VWERRGNSPRLKKLVVCEASQQHTGRNKASIGHRERVGLDQGRDHGNGGKVTPTLTRARDPPCEGDVLGKKKEGGGKIRPFLGGQSSRQPKVKS